MIRYPAHLWVPVSSHPVNLLSPPVFLLFFKSRSHTCFVTIIMPRIHSAISFPILFSGSWSSASSMDFSALGWRLYDDDEEEYIKTCLSGN